MASSYSFSWTVTPSTGPAHGALGYGGPFSGLSTYGYSLDTEIPIDWMGEWLLTSDDTYEASVPGTPSGTMYASTGYIAEAFEGSDLTLSDDEELSYSSDQAYIAQSWDPDSEVLENYGISRITPYVIGSFDFIPLINRDTSGLDDNFSTFLDASLVNSIYTRYQAAGVLELWGSTTNVPTAAGPREDVADWYVPGSDYYDDDITIGSTAYNLNDYLTKKMSSVTNNSAITWLDPVNLMQIYYNLIKILGESADACAMLIETVRLGLHTKVRTDDLLATATFLTNPTGERGNSLYFSSESTTVGGTAPIFVGPGLWENYALTEDADHSYDTWCETLMRTTALEMTSNGEASGLNGIFINAMCFPAGTQGFSDTTIIAQLLTDIKRSILVCTPYTDYNEIKDDSGQPITSRDIPSSTLSVVDDHTDGGNYDGETTSDAFTTLAALQQYLTNIAPSALGTETIEATYADDYPSEDNFYLFLDSLPSSTIQATTMVCHLLARDLSCTAGKSTATYVDAVEEVIGTYTGHGADPVDTGARGVAHTVKDWTVESTMQEIIGRFSLTSPPPVASLMSATVISRGDISDETIGDGRDIILPLETRCDETNDLDSSLYQPGLEYIKESFIFDANDIANPSESVSHQSDVVSATGDISTNLRDFAPANNSRLSLGTGGTTAETKAPMTADALIAISTNIDITTTSDYTGGSDPVSDSMYMGTILGNKPAQLIKKLSKMIAGLTGNYAFKQVLGSGITAGDEGLVTDFGAFLPTNTACFEAFLTVMTRYFSDESNWLLYGDASSPIPGGSSINLKFKYETDTGDPLEVLKLAILCHVGENTDNQELMYHFCRYIEALTNHFSDEAASTAAYTSMVHKFGVDSDGNVTINLGMSDVDMIEMIASANPNLILACEKLAAVLLGMNGGIYVDGLSDAIAAGDEIFTDSDDLEVRLEYSVTKYEFEEDSAFGLVDHIAYNAILLSPIGLALVGVEPRFGDLFYQLSQIPRVMAEIIANRISGDISDADPLDNTGLDLYELQHLYPYGWNSAFKYGDIIDSFGSPLVTYTESYGDGTMNAYGSVYGGFNYITYPTKYESTSSVSEMYGLTRGTHIRATTAIFTRLLSELFGDNAPQLVSSHSSSFWITDDDDIIPEGSMDVIEGLGEVNVLWSYYPLQAQAVSRSIQIDSAHWEYYGLGDYGAYLRANTETADEHGYESGLVDELDHVIAIQDILLPIYENLYKEDIILYTMLLALQEWGVSLVDMSTRAESLFDGKLVSLGDTPCVKPYLQMGALCGTKSSFLFANSGNMISTRQMIARKYLTHRWANDQYDSSSTSVGITGYLPVPVGQSDSIMMFSLLKWCLEKGCSLCDTDTTGETVATGFHRSADFVDATADDGKKILVLGIPTGMINQMIEDAIQGADVDTCRQLELCTTVIIRVYKYDLETYDVVYPDPKNFIFDLSLYFPEVMPEAYMEDLGGTNTTTMSIQSIWPHMTGMGDTTGPTSSQTDYITCTSMFAGAEDYKYSGSQVSSWFTGVTVVGGYHPGFGEMLNDSKISYSSNNIVDTMLAVHDIFNDGGLAGSLVAPSWTDTDLFYSIPLYMWSPWYGPLGSVHEPYAGMPSGLGDSNFVFLGGTGDSATTSDQTALWTPVGETSSALGSVVSYQTSMTGISAPYQAEAAANCITDAILKTYVRTVTGIDISESGFPMFPTAECLRPGSSELELDNGWNQTSDPDAASQITVSNGSADPEGYGVHDIMRFFAPHSLMSWAHDGSSSSASDEHTGLFGTSLAADAGTSLFDFTQTDTDGFTAPDSTQITTLIESMVDAIAVDYAYKSGADSASALPENLKQAMCELPIVGMSGYMCKIVLPKLFERTMAILIDPESFTPYEMFATYNDDGSLNSYDQEEITEDYRSKIFGFYTTIELFQESS